jgi:signal transduction histidine kinase/DNA-binding response OmpR family regulator
MWVGSYNGLCRINCDNLEDIKYYTADSSSKGLSNSRIYSVVQDQRQNLFVGEWGSVDYFDKKTERFTRIDTFSDLAGKQIRKLMLSSKGNLWVATESNGVYVIDTVHYSVIEHYVASQGLSSNSVFEFHEDKNGTVWIGTFGGLNSVDSTGLISSYPEIDKELPSTLIYKIFSDSTRNLWCATIKGVVKVNTEENYVRVYDHADGIMVSEFSEGAGFRDQKGNIFLGGIGGLISFNPAYMKINNDVPDVFLNSLLVDQQKVELPYPRSVSDSLTLSFWHNSFSFSIQSILISSPHKNRIGWKLVPLENNFKYHSGSIHNIQYQGLRSGRYTLVVKSANADGIWSEEKKLITITIAKPFWREFYFILALVVFLLILIVFIIRIRFNQIKKKSERLEEMVHQRTMKIEKQKLELEKANEALKQKNQKVQAQKDQILAQRDHLLEMSDRQEELTRLSENFFANISHDIRTPLTLIYGPANELLREKDLPGKIKSKVEIIQSNTRYIIQLLDHIIDRKKLETGGAVKIFTHGNIVDTCKLVVNLFREQAGQNSIDLSFESNLSEYFIRFDHEKLKQILLNILANAMKFTPRRGIIRCGLTIENEQLKIEVWDTGIGIPPDRIKHIFDRYYQIGKSSIEKNKGLGIGLSMVKDYVQILNGRVTVDSEEGKGSRFIVELPVVQPRFVDDETDNFIDDEANNTKEFFSTGISKDVSGETVLLVENNDGLRQYLQEFLSRYFKVVSVKNGKEAFKYLKKNNAVDIVLSDWIMPEMDGIELCRAIRRKSRFQTLPFILLTALTDIDHEKEGYFAGITDFIPKPFDPEIVCLKITKQLRLNSQIQQKLRVSEVTRPDEIVVETFNDKLLKKIMVVVEEEMSNVNFDPLTLANRIGMSPTQLYRKIKEFVKMTPTEFIRSVRIKRAAQLLENENILINEVSDLVGFNDPKYFSRCFSKEKGVSPSQYRSFSLKKSTSSD